MNLKAARTEAPSRGKKGKGKAKDIDLDDYPLQEPREEEAAAAPEPPAQAAGKKGKKQGLSLDDFPEDPEQDAAVASAAEAQDEPGQHPSRQSLAAAAFTMHVHMQCLTGCRRRAAHPVWFEQSPDITVVGARNVLRLCMDMAL